MFIERGDRATATRDWTVPGTNVICVTLYDRYIIILK